MEIGNIFCLTGDIWIFVFIEMVIERSIVCLLWILSKSLNVIGCQGNIKGKFSNNIKKSSSLKP